MPSAENVFSDFIKNNPALTTNAFTAIGEVDCFTKVPLLSNKESEFLGILSRNIIPDYSVFPKIRLIEFVRPHGSEEAVKDLIREVQNITCDFVLKSYDETVWLLSSLVKLQPSDSKRKTDYPACVCYDRNFFLPI